VGKGENDGREVEGGGRSEGREGRLVRGKVEGWGKERKMKGRGRRRKGN
jgi:hypothetical protein